MKLTQVQIDEIRDEVEGNNKRFYGKKAMAKKYNVSEWTIRAVVNYHKAYCKN